ncbi:MAG TPA: glycoside hydrolase family 130 protein [Terrimicrobiaceae bacterium]
MPDCAERFPQNPILAPQDIAPSLADLQIQCLLNPGCFRFDHKIWLLLRVAEQPLQPAGKTIVPIFDSDGGIELLEFDHNDPKLDHSDPRVCRYDGVDYLTTISHLRPVCSEDGIHFHEQDAIPPVVAEGELESYGIEDCRVVQIGEDYYLSYTAVSANGVGVGLRSTRNWRHFSRHGLIFPPHNKDCAIFAETLNGMFLALHRPSSPEIGGNFIWLAESPDLRHWGRHRCLARTRPGMWDSTRVGAGAAPIRTTQGWLEIYHGANAQNRYCLGALLLDLEEPWRVLARSREPIMEPIATYEREGFFGNVIFSNGHLTDGDELTLYYGASDSVICGARFSIREILASL